MKQIGLGVLVSMVLASGAGAQPQVFPMESAGVHTLQKQVRHAGETRRCQQPSTEFSTTTLQRVLQRAGYDVGGVDGLLGPSTRRAIERAERGIGGFGQIDGCIDVTERNVLVQVGRAREAGISCDFPNVVLGVNTDVLEWYSEQDFVHSWSRNNELSQAVSFVRGTIAFELSVQASRPRFLTLDCWLRSSEWWGLQRQLEQSGQDAIVAAGAPEDPAPTTVNATDEQTLNTDDLLTMQRQLSATLAVLADMREAWTSPDQRAELDAQLEAANQEIASLRSEVVSADEHEQVQRQLDAANTALADQDESSVPLAQYEELERQLSAANASIADLTERVGTLEPSEAVLRMALADARTQIAMLSEQRDALNTTLANLNESSVSVSEYEESLRQLAAANVALSDLQDTIETEYVPRSVAMEIDRRLNAANAAIADLRGEIDSQYVPLANHSEALRQISALNETVTVLTERTDTFRSRWLDAQRVYDAFIEDCRENPTCANAMELE